MEEIIDKARFAIKTLADEYQPKKDSKWFEYHAEISIKTFDEDQGTYCEDCCEKRKDEILNDPETDFPEDFQELVISTETSKENEGFLTCDLCGEIIECAIIWDEEELHVWTSLTKSEWLNMIHTPYYYYQISKILDETYGATEEYPKECLKIAMRVLRYWI